MTKWLLFVQDDTQYLVKEAKSGDSIHSLLSILDVLTVRSYFPQLAWKSSQTLVTWMARLFGLKGDLALLECYFNFFATWLTSSHWSFGCKQKRFLWVSRKFCKQWILQKVGLDKRKSYSFHACGIQVFKVLLFNWFSGAVWQIWGV